MKSTPGFTAEVTLSRTRERFLLATEFDSKGGAASVQPAARKLCDVVAELVWAAYNEGAYNRAEFWGRVMERAGCFS